MTGISTPSPNRGVFVTDDGKNVGVTFALVSSLFLLWGVCNGMIDVMDKHFQDALHLSKGQSAWVQFAHYMGYCFMSLPAGYFAKKLGYKGGIITGLCIVSAAGFWFVPAGHIGAFWAYLVGVFALAMGLTFLETIANPYTTVLGPRKFASMRINLAQSCNGIGWILGPIIGGLFFYNSQGDVAAASQTIYVPYVTIAIVVLLLAGVFAMAYMPDIVPADDYEGAAGGHSPSRSIWSHPHFTMAVAAQFFYVAAQAGIFSFFINYIVAEIPPITQQLATVGLLSGGATLRDGNWFVNEAGATRLLSAFGFVLFLLGRFVGTGLMRKFDAARVLGIFAVANTVLMLVIFLKIGWISCIALFLSFFFMSIMFPTIFALGISGLGEKSKSASSFIVMAIMGGALMPKLMGHIGDLYNMSKGFIVPLFCFVFIAFYGFTWSKLVGTPATPAPQPLDEIEPVIP
ncbi:MAG TPA: sugar MFS transporter [Capsulimonadaceae bacterium]